MLGDSLCQRCPDRKTFLDARDAMLAAALEYGRLSAEAEGFLARAQATYERTKAQNEKVKALADDLRVELKRTPKPVKWHEDIRFWDGLLAGTVLTALASALVRVAVGG